MSHLQYYAYPGKGESAKKNFKYSQAVRVGDRIECAGQGNLHHNATESLVTNNRPLRWMGSPNQSHTRRHQRTNRPSIRKRRARSKECWGEGVVASIPRKLLPHPHG
jgi:hypothetical protein